MYSLSKFIVFFFLLMFGFANSQKKPNSQIFKDLKYIYMVTKTKKFVKPSINILKEKIYRK